MDTEAGTLIPSGDSFMDKITWKTQPSVKAALRHCARIAQGVKTSDDLVETPLCDLPSTQKTKFKFFSPQNVLGREHYRLRMDETAEYLPMPPSLRSITGASPNVNQYTVSVQTLLPRGVDEMGSHIQLHDWFPCGFFAGTHPIGRSQDCPGANEDYG